MSKSFEVLEEIINAAAAVEDTKEAIEFLVESFESSDNRDAIVELSDDKVMSKFENQHGTIVNRLYRRWIEEDPNTFFTHIPPLLTFAWRDLIEIVFAGVQTNNYANRKSLYDHVGSLNPFADTDFRREIGSVLQFRAVRLRRSEYLEPVFEDEYDHETEFFAACGDLMTHF